MDPDVVLPAEGRWMISGLAAQDASFDHPLLRPASSLSRGSHGQGDAATGFLPAPPKAARPKTPDFVRRTVQKLGADSARTGMPGCPKVGAVEKLHQLRSAAASPSSPEALSEVSIDGWAKSTLSNSQVGGHVPLVTRAIRTPTPSFYDGGAVEDRYAVKAILAQDLDRYRNAFSEELRAQLDEISRMLRDTDVRCLVERFMEESELMHAREARSQKECENLRRHVEELLRLNANLRQQELIQIMTEMRDWAKLINEDSSRMRQMTDRVALDTESILVGLGMDAGNQAQARAIKIEAQLSQPVSNHSSVASSGVAGFAVIEDAHIDATEPEKLKRARVNPVVAGISVVIAEEVRKVIAVELEPVMRSLKKEEQLIASQFAQVKDSLSHIEAEETHNLEAIEQLGATHKQSVNVFRNFEQSFKVEQEKEIARHQDKMKAFEEQLAEARTNSEKKRMSRMSVMSRGSVLHGSIMETVIMEDVEEEDGENNASPRATVVDEQMLSNCIANSLDDYLAPDSEFAGYLRLLSDKTDTVIEATQNELSTQQRMMWVTTGGELLQNTKSILSVCEQSKGIVDQLANPSKCIIACLNKIDQIESRGHVRINLKSGEVEFLREIPFVAKRPTESPDGEFADTKHARAVLQDVMQLWQLFRVSTTVEGHTKGGESQFYQNLADSRAQCIADMLQEMQLPRDMLVVKGLPGKLGINKATIALKFAIFPDHHAPLSKFHASSAKSLSSTH